MADDPNSTVDTPSELTGAVGALTPTAAEPSAAGQQPAGVVAMVRLAAVLIDPDGRIALWTRAAEELFGHRTGAVQDRLDPRAAAGRGAADRQRAAAAAARRCDAFDTLDDLTRTGAWAA